MVRLGACLCCMLLLLLQNALADLSDQAQNASSAQRMEAEREAAAMRAALEAQLQSEASFFFSVAGCV